MAVENPVLASNADALSDISTRRGTSRFSAFAYALFVLLGVVTTLLGPLLPLLAARWSITTAHAAELFFWQFASSTTGTVFSGVALSRRSFKIPIVMGLGLCVLGVAALSFADFSRARFAVSIFGIGLGIALPAINLAVAEANPGHPAASVSLLNFSWAVGAISGPTLVLILRNLNVFLLSIASALLLGLLVSVCLPTTAWNRARDDADQRIGKRKSRFSAIVLFALMMFLFVGVENAVAGWASSLAQPSFSNAYTATVATIAFWSCFLCGRALAPLVLHAISELQFLSAGVLCALSGVLVFYLASNVTGTVIGCSLSGLGIAPCFPILISRVADTLGAHDPFSVVCFACAGFGGAVIPPLVGKVALYSGRPKMGLSVPFIALLALYWLGSRIPVPVRQGESI